MLSSQVDNWHETLGVAHNANPEQIKRAFRKRVRACHPDLNRGSRESEAELKRIIRAYRALSDVRRRDRAARLDEAFRNAGSHSAQSDFVARAPDRLLNLDNISRWVKRVTIGSAVVTLLGCLALIQASAAYRPVQVDAAVFLIPYLESRGMQVDSESPQWQPRKLTSLR